MKIQVSAPTAAFVALAKHADPTSTLSLLSQNGALLAFDFSDCDTVEKAIERVDAMDAYLGLTIAETDDATEIAELSALKSAVASIRSDVRREYAYKTRVRDTAEASDADAESQLHANSHTDISNSADSNGAVAEKEVSENGTTPEAEQPVRTPAGRRRKR